MGTRTINQLAEIVNNRKIRLTLSSEEKKMIKDKHLHYFRHKFTNTYCPPCWARAIRTIAKHEENLAPKKDVVSEKMVENTPTDYSQMKLSELRELFPEIKANSIAKFVKLIEEYETGE